jgi:hypothetical protein
MLKTGGLSGLIVRLAVLVGMVCAGAALSSQPVPALTIALTGQSMIRSDIRATAPAAILIIQGLLKGDVIFTNLEAAVAEKGQTIQEGRGFLISFRAIILNPIGDGQPDVHNPYADNEFLHTRGLPSPATGARAGHILRRLADASRLFGTRIAVQGETATIAPESRR